MNYKRILVTGDTHAPFVRASYIGDLKRLIRSFNPDLIVHTGDLIDSHAISHHTPESDSDSAVSEYTKSKGFVRRLSDAVGNIPLKMCIGNHDIRALKLAADVRIPAHFLKPYAELYGLPKHWSLEYEHIVNGILFCHGRSAVAGKTALAYGMSSVEGHYHSLSEIKYYKHYNSLIWSAYVGSPADENAYAMRYAKNNLKRSIYSFLLIESNIPRIVPMV